MKEPGLLKGDWGRPKLWFEWLEGPPLGTKLRELDGLFSCFGETNLPNTNQPFNLFFHFAEFDMFLVFPLVVLKGIDVGLCFPGA